MAHIKQRQKPCAHTKQKHKHMASKTNHQPCAKQDTNTQLMRILIRPVFTQDMTSWKQQPMKTQATCHTAQDITWINAADKNQTACNTTKHNTRGQKSVRPSELETPRSHNETEHGARVSKPSHETETQDMSAGIRTLHSNMKQGTQTRESTARAHSKPHAHTKTGHYGSVRALSQNLWMTLDRSDRTLTLIN